MDDIVYKHKTLYEVKRLKKIKSFTKIPLHFLGTPSRLCFSGHALVRNVREDTF